MFTEGWWQTADEASWFFADARKTRKGMISLSELKKVQKKSKLISYLKNIKEMKEHFKFFFFIFSLFVATLVLWWSFQWVIEQRKIPFTVMWRWCSRDSQVQQGDFTEMCLQGSTLLCQCPQTVTNIKPAVYHVCSKNVWWDLFLF